MISQRFVLQANKDRVKTLAERKAESEKLESEIFRIRKANNPASEAAAAQYMSKTFTPYVLQTSPSPRIWSIRCSN